MNNWRKVFSWQIQRERRDTRFLFQPMVSRKPPTWDDVKIAEFYSLPEISQESLLSKQIIDMDLEYPLDIFPVNVPAGPEFIIHELSDNKYYYTNTEGYDYAKYIFEIVNFPNN